MADEPIGRLASLLEGSGARPIVVPSRLAPSAIYDVEYRIAVIALVFERFSKPFGSGEQRRISSAKLKLLQFVAFRPWLVSAIREWSEAEGQASLALSRSMRNRRGFLSDTAHEDLINLLVICGMFIRAKSHLVTGPRAGELSRISLTIKELQLFGGVRQVISELEEIPLTQTMLEGW